MFNKLFVIASNLATPLALGGFLAAAFFLLAKQVIAKNIFPILTKKLSTEVIKLIIHYIFILFLLSMILGFIGYVIPLLPENDHKNDNKLSSKLKWENLQVEHIETFTLYSESSKNDIFGGFLLFGNDGLWEGKTINGSYQLINITGKNDVRYYFAGIQDQKTMGEKDISNATISVEVKVEFLKDSKEFSGAGLMYRFDRENKFYYAFIIQKNQIFTFYKRNEGGYVTLYSGRSNIIRENGYNKIAIDSNGSNFNLYINENLVKALEDSELTYGDTGIIAMSIGIYSFDNLTIYGPVTLRSDK